MTPSGGGALVLMAGVMMLALVTLTTAGDQRLTDRKGDRYYDRELNCRIGQTFGISIQHVLIQFD